MEHFYNTIGLDELALLAEVQNAKDQEEAVIKIFEIIKHPMTPDTVHKHYKENVKDIPLTSIRRAMTNLTKQGRLIKTDDQEIGRYGKPNFKWRLAVEVKKEPCEEHKMMNKKLGYIEHQEWMQKQINRGQEQKQCLKCGRWLFPSEF